MASVQMQIWYENYESYIAVGSIIFSKSSTRKVYCCSLFTIWWLAWTKFLHDSKNKQKITCQI